MKQLWAPWRIQYILSPKSGECVFCAIAASSKDRENLILFRGKLNYILMNRFPYNSGHVMIVPYEHRSGLDGYDSAVLDEMMSLTSLCTDVLGSVLRPEGFNAGLNIGAAAGAGIKEHLHMHVVPRWVGDSSFMAVLDEVRVVPEHLLSTYDKIKEAFIKKHAQGT